MNPVHNEFGTNLIEINVPSYRKRVVLRDLEAFGITRSSLFPDLDGLAMEINHSRRRYVNERMKAWPVSEDEIPGLLAEIDAKRGQGPAQSDTGATGTDPPVS